MDECKFKSDYFSDFDLTPLTRPTEDGSLPYTTENIAFLRDFQFNFCEYLPDTESFAIMTDPATGE